MSEKVKVSIVMPSLNVASYIEECILSAVNQTLKEIEIICIDAGSTDGTWEILSKYAALDHRIRLISSDVKSYGAQVNMGIQMSSGDYIAILETDDFIDLHMYETLFEVAETENVNYVKADFEGYRRLSNGERVFLARRIFPKEKEYLYGQVICPKEYLEICCGDFSLWRGIYKRDFLVSNQIVLNETQGAAYQDIGFNMQVLHYAKRALYLPDLFYKYCEDREDASSRDNKCIYNCYVEYAKVKDFFQKCGDDKDRILFYLRVTYSVLGEYAKIAREEHNSTSYFFNQEYYTWFKNELSEGVEKGILRETCFGRQSWNDLNLFINEFPSFVMKKKEEQEKLRHRIEQFQLHDIVVFGCGQRGKYALAELDKAGVRPVAMVDNNKALWGSFCGGIEILNLHECMVRFQGAYYLVENELHAEEIRQQLLAAGIQDEEVMSLC